MTPQTYIHESCICTSMVCACYFLSAAGMFNSTKNCWVQPPPFNLLEPTLHTQNAYTSQSHALGKHFPRRVLHLSKDKCIYIYIFRVTSPIFQGIKTSKRSASLSWQLGVVTIHLFMLRGISRWYEACYHLNRGDRDEGIWFGVGCFSFCHFNLQLNITVCVYVGLKPV